MNPENEAELEIARRIADGESVDLTGLGQGDPDLARRLAKLQSLAQAMQGPGTSGSRWGHLQQLQLAGQGGFGAVYRAYDPTLDRTVALKLRHTDSAAMLPSGADFVAEARRLARVRHPNVLAVHGASYHDGRAGLWTDWIDGKTLTERLDRTGPLRGEELLRVLGELAEALAAVHKAGLVHGDVKASNVMLDGQGRVILMDFGAGFESSSEGSRMGAGTPRYLAPEILAGRDATLAVDLYAYGVLAHLLATHRYPDPASALALPAPRRLRKLIARLLSANPDLRPRTDEVSRILQTLVDAPRLRVRRGLQASVVIGLAGIALATSIGLRREQAQLKRAERVSDFLAALFREQDPLSRNAQAERKPEVVVADAVNRVETELADDLPSQARLLRVLGEAQLNLSELDAARVTLDLAADKAVATDEALLGAEVDALRGVLARMQLRNEDAERYFELALKQASAAAGSQSVAVGRIKAMFGTTLVALSRNKDAQAYVESAHALLSSQLGADHPEAISALVSLGSVQEQLRQDDEALANLKQSVMLIERRFGPEDARLMRPLTLLGEVQRRSRAFNEGRASLQRGIRIARLRMGERDSMQTKLWITLSRLESDAGDKPAAIAALDAAERAQPENETNNRAQLSASRGRLWMELDDGARAEPDLRLALKLRRETGGLRNGIAWYSQAELGLALAMQGKFKESQELLAEAQSELRKLLKPDAYQNALIADRYAEAYALAQDWQAAENQAREALRIALKAYGHDHFIPFAYQLGLAGILSQTRAGQAEATQIVDGLIKRWANSEEIAAEYAELMLLRCNLYAGSADYASARELASATLRHPGLVASAKTLADLKRHADHS